jgi:hypothetical protein
MIKRIIGKILCKLGSHDEHIIFGGYDCKRPGCKWKHEIPYPGHWTGW